MRRDLMEAVVGVGVSSSPILGCGESSTLPSPLLHEEPRDGRRTMWSGLKNALEMFHSFSMARPWSEGPLAAGRSDCVQAAEPNEDPSSATEAALVIAPASPLLSTPIHAHRVRRYDRRATFVAPAPPPRHQVRPLEFPNSKASLQHCRGAACLPGLRRLHTGQTFELPEWSAARRCARPLSALGPAPPQGVQGAQKRARVP